MGCSSNINSRLNYNQVIKNENKEKRKDEYKELKQKEKKQLIKKEEYVKVNLKIPKGGKLKELELTPSEKEISQSVFNSLPKRSQTNFQTIKDIIKSKTEKLNQLQKSYVLFLWICDNISYDAKFYYAGLKVDCIPEGVFRTGLSVCSGYARLYKNIAFYLNLEVECVSCYSKGASYTVGKNMNETNHEYNVIKLNNKWYPVESTWGAGNVDGRYFKKEFKEIYFLPNPELLITSHFPKDDKWQLTKEKYTLEEFLNWPIITLSFYDYGFKSFEPKVGLIELKNCNMQKFIIYGDNMNHKVASCKIIFLYERQKFEQDNISNINYYNERFEIYCI